MEETVFTRALGNSPVIRVIDFLIEGRELDYSLTDIAGNSNIGWTTLHRIWDKLENLEIVQFTRKIGKAKLYRINVRNPAVRQLIRLHKTLLKMELHSKRNHQALSAPGCPVSQAASLSSQH